MRTARIAFAIALLSACAIALPATAGERQDRDARDKAVREACKGNDARDCRDYRANSVRWSSIQYKGFYKRHFAANADPEIARIFGVDPNTLSASNQAKYMTHAERCAARYPSYKAASDSYAGADGKMRPCNL